jgi:hypothetical protein
VTVGGNKDDIVSCIVYDRTNNLVLVGGATESDDFGPASAKRGFMFALDNSGEMEWSFTYKNKSSSLTEVTGCQVSADGKDFVVLGLAETQVVMMLLNPANG